MDLFKIKYPIVQAGMVWCSGWKLASAVSNAGGLGLIGAGSMYPDVLEHHIKQCQNTTDQPFGVNVPLLYPDIEKLMEVIVSNNVKIVFTSAGNPKTWTKTLKDHDIMVAHVVSSVKFAIKSQESGVDAVVAEGFEAGGHNGREETTTFCLVPAVRDAVSIPLIAAGGIASGRTILAAEALGADGVQIGSRFAICNESSAHDNYKTRVIQSSEGETTLTLKQLAPVRLIKNAFYEEVLGAERNGATTEELRKILGRGRAKKGIYEGDLDAGELEIGQVAAYMQERKSAKEIVDELWKDYRALKTQLTGERG